MKVVVTGATGNLGTSTIAALAHEPAISEIVGVARRKPDIHVEKCTFVAADIVHADLDTLFRGASAVVHLAWLIQPLRDPRLLESVNVGGTRRVLDAAQRTGARAVIVASSVGAYAPGPKDTTVDESWPTQGIPSSLYSRQKVQVERLLDLFEIENPALRVIRMRPALVFKAQAASEIRRLFVGPWLPKFLLHPARVPFVPDVDRLRFQCIHSSDVGRAFARAVLSEARGGINLATDPVLDPEILAATLRAPRLRIHPGLVRSAVHAAWHLRLTPIDRGWVDIALGVPLMNTDKARRELGFVPELSATDTLLELMHAMSRGTGFATPPLEPRGSSA